jgi:ribosomal protein L29
MVNEYICDDRNVLEDAQAIRSMTDEEFKSYLDSLKNEQTKD